MFRMKRSWKPQITFKSASPVFLVQKRRNDKQEKQLTSIFQVSILFSIYWEKRSLFLTLNSVPSAKTFKFSSHGFQPGFDLRTSLILWVINIFHHEICCIMKTKNYMLLIVVGLTFQLMAQDKSGQGSSVAKPVLDVYINCISCDFQYLKENMSYLTFHASPKRRMFILSWPPCPLVAGARNFWWSWPADKGLQLFTTHSDLPPAPIWHDPGSEIWCLTVWKPLLCLSF